MRIERLSVQAFGRLAGFDTGPDPLGELVVVQGPNEAGKTTLFHLLATVLYGFAPATRDAHPYAPWSGAEPSGSARIRLADGRTWDVHRRLRATPLGTLERDGAVEELRNRPLPWAEHVPATVFRQVYAVTLAELSGLDGEGWARIQDRLLTALGAGDLRPARAVADELEQEAGQLWRPNRRGRQAIRELRDRLRTQEHHRREVAGADQDLRERVRELERTRAELAQVRAEREAAKLYLERFGALLTVRTALARVRALEEEAGPPERRAALPADPARRLAELAERARAERTRLDQVERDAAAARRRHEGLPAPEARVLEQADAIERVAARVQAAGWTKARAGQLQQELRELEARVETEAADLFTVPWDRLPLDALRALPASELRGAARALEEARARLAARTEAERELALRAAEDARRARAARRPWPVVGGIALALAVGLAGGAWRLDLPALWAGAALALGVGATLLLLGLRRPRPTSAAASETGPLRADVDAAEHALLDPLAGLPLRPGPARAPGALVAGLERLQLALRQHRDRELERTELRAQEAELAAAASDLARACGLAPAPYAGATAHLLGATLTEMRRRRSAAEHAAEDAERMEQQRDREREGVARTAAEEAELRARLGALAGGDPVAGLARFRSMVQAEAGAARLRDDLAAAHPDLADLAARIRAAEAEGADWVVDDHALARRRALIETLDERVEKLVERAASLDAEIDQLGTGETVDRVDGEIAVLEADVRGLERDRDRRALLARIVREADRRFREEHQPDLLRRAGEYLATITGGRYARVLVAESADDAPFKVRGGEGAAPVDVRVPLSTATREQIWLALRLAALDHLDREGERLPVFLDEALVNWDRDRRERGLALLAEVARTRQVFVFTCHEDVAGALGARGARVIALPGPR